MSTRYSLYLLCCWWLTSGCRTTDSQTLGLSADCQTKLAEAEPTLAFVKTLDKVSKKTPVGVYITVDTAEPFMQLAVDQDLKDLREVCEAGGPETNWISFVNSHYVHGDGSVQYTICQKGTYKELPFAADFREYFAFKNSLIFKKKRFVVVGVTKKLVFASANPGLSKGTMSFLMLIPI